MAQRPTVSSANNTLALLKAHSEVVIPQQELDASTGAAGEQTPEPMPEENLDPAIGGNDELINLVVNSGSPNRSQFASYNSYSAVVTPF